MTKPVCIYNAANVQEAHLVVNLLTGEGLSARVASNAVETLAGEVPFQKAVCPVWVPEEEAAKAAAVLEKHQAELQKPPRVGLFCYHCGIELAAPESSCPSCHEELDWD